jgi:hypothetical protein
MRRNLISSFHPVMRRSGVTARLEINMISDHDPVNRVMNSIGLTPRSPV